MAKQDHSSTVVLLGNASAVQFGDENLLLGKDHPIGGNTDLTQIVPVSRVISGRRVSVINLLGLQETDLPQHTVDQLTCNLLNEHGFHAFIYVLCQLTDSDKLGLDWVQNMFGDSALSFTMMLFTYERVDCDTIIDELKKNPVLEQLLAKCGGRYYTSSKSMNRESEIKTLLEKVDQMVSENKQPFYSADMFSSALKLRKDTQDRQQRGCNLHLQQEKVDKKMDPTELNETIPEPDSDGCSPEKNKQITQLFTKLLGAQKKTLKLTDVLQLNPPSPQTQMSCSDLVASFLQKLLMGDYRARGIYDEDETSEENDSQPVTNNTNSSELSTLSETDDEADPVHPMDVQMTVFHWSDSFLKQFLVTKLAQCQYSLPLLVPNPETKELEFPLWTFGQISRSWKSSDKSGKVSNITMPIWEAKTPMVAFFRFGSVSSSKSQLINNLINEKHPTFFHRQCPGSSSNRLLMDGVVEIAWYYPSGTKADHFKDCVAFCNLRGDAEVNTKQLDILTEMSSVNVVLLSDPNDEKKYKTLQKLFETQKPLIFLFANLNKSNLQKHRISLNKAPPVITKELKQTLKKCVSPSSTCFRVRNVGDLKTIKIDESDDECQKGKVAALQIMALLDRKDLSKVKETYLPCQGKLWHDWSQKNKELHRPKGTNTEMQKSAIQSEMKQLREKQHECGVSSLMKLFIDTLSSSGTNERDYFLKWLNIMLGQVTTDGLSDICQANDESFPNVGVLGLEHILREMGQIYESFKSVQIGKERADGQDFLSLPKLAAEVVLSGYPLELMDGDAAHVPLLWVSAVLDELMNKLGDQRVFVLSVLGIQSSGKSTLLNTMFGLQFAVSAGRCTRGAFMQLVRVSKEMKSQLKIDYILVIDTEGLRSLEQTGRTPVYHDNKLATFVIGLGNLTLINVYGENHAEMQDILQIVVQALLRMKKVRLKPSCMFVHQNVLDINATEKTKAGRRSLKKKLDEMTRLAAKEEDSEAKGFQDIIEFDIEKDVMYFAQLTHPWPQQTHPTLQMFKN